MCKQLSKAFGSRRRNGKVSSVAATSCPTLTHTRARSRRDSNADEWIGFIAFGQRCGAYKERTLSTATNRIYCDAGTRKPMILDHPIRVAAKSYPHRNGLNDKRIRFHCVSYFLRSRTSTGPNRAKSRQVRSPMIRYFFRLSASCSLSLAAPVRMSRCAFTEVAKSTYCAYRKSDRTGRRGQKIISLSSQLIRRVRLGVSANMVEKNDFETKSIDRLPDCIFFLSPIFSRVCWSLCLFSYLLCAVETIVEISLQVLRAASATSGCAVALSTVNN